MKRYSLIWRTVLIGTAGVVLLGCRAGGPSGMPTEQEKVEMLSLMLPSELKIEPFTKFKSFDQDEQPDGVLLVLRPVDRFGDPVKAAGVFYFELWTYNESDPLRKGERLAYWERTIGTKQDMKLYWTRAQMYEFQLVWTAGVGEVKPGRKYLLTATYRPPWDETIQAEYLMQAPHASELTGKPMK